MPGSFSKECHEDILAFKSRILAASKQRRDAIGVEDDGMSFKFLELNDDGQAFDVEVELNV